MTITSRTAGMTSRDDLIKTRNSLISVYETLDNGVYDESTSSKMTAIVEATQILAEIIVSKA